jgi:hypothetical protein
MTLQCIRDIKATDFHDGTPAAKIVVARSLSEWRQESFKETKHAYVTIVKQLV